MTRGEFLEDITCWDDLLAFCNENGCNVCEDIYSRSNMNDYINDVLVDMARNADDWQDLWNELDIIPIGYDFYIKNEYGEFTGADVVDFDDYKNDVLEWADDEEVFDEDEEYEDSEEAYDEDTEDDEQCEEDPDDDYVVGDEGMSIAELFVVPKNENRGVYNV